jgi:hypothetical protein
MHGFAALLQLRLAIGEANSRVTTARPDDPLPGPLDVDVKT